MKASLENEISGQFLETVAESNREKLALGPKTSADSRQIF
jgi:hypothetical protein